MVGLRVKCETSVLPSCPYDLICLSKEFGLLIGMITEMYVMRQKEMYFRMFYSPFRFKENPL